MLVQLSARFSSPDDADAALRRLRRSGISFELADISGCARDIPASGFPGAMVNIVYPYSMINSMDTVPGYVLGGQRIGARALISSDGLPIGRAPMGEATLKINVPREKSESAAAILRSAHGYGVKAVR
jgi:hypothetical protein